MSTHVVCSTALQNCQTSKHNGEAGTVTAVGGYGQVMRPGLGSDVR